MTEQGLRRRIVTPAPPAPVPAPRETKPAREELEDGAPDKSLLTTSPKGETIAPPQTADSVAVGEPQAAEGGEKVVRATGSMAVAEWLNSCGLLRGPRVSLFWILGQDLALLIKPCFGSTPNKIKEDWYRC